MRQRFKRTFFRSVPDAPGVYLMFDEEGEVLYIGKSIRLRTRLLSYRSARPDQVSNKVLRLVCAVRDIRWEPCKSDQEACLRENFLLRNYRPPFNVVNTKSFIYEYIVWQVVDGVYYWKLTPLEEIPDGAAVFGAFKGRRATKRAYQALIRLLWVMTREIDRVSDLPHELMLEKAPRNYSFNVPAPLTERLQVLIPAFLQGEDTGLIDWFLERLNSRHAIEAFLRQWMETEMETLADFYVRTLRSHREMRAMMPGDGAIIPQEKVDDLLLLHKNAQPICSQNEVIYGQETEE